MDKKYYFGIGVLVALLLIFTVPKYFTGNVVDDISIDSDIEKIEVIHFHSTNQCYSCITMGNLAEETVNIYFGEELNSGKITFQHLNVDLSENNNKVIEYGATGSSLFIGTYYADGTFIKEENTNVWYKINDKFGYHDYLKGVIESKLSGE